MVARRLHILLAAALLLLSMLACGREHGVEPTYYADWWRDPTCPAGYWLGEANGNGTPICWRK